MWKLALAGAALAGLQGPAVALPKSTNIDLPPWTGAYEPEDLDERGFWHEMDELENKLKFSKFVVKDGRLQTYLEDVLCETVGADRCTAARIYIVRENAFNAGMYPNGMMIVHTGLLLRMRNEAELASVLGHEFGHFEERHTLARFQRQRTSSDIVMWAAILAGIDLTNAATLSYFSYSRNNETEADLVGVRYLQASPYPSRAAAEVWIRQIDEDDARAEERHRRKRGRHTSWFASHPAPFARADYLARAAEAAADEGDYRADRYAEAMEPFILGFFDDQLQRNDFAASKFILDEMAGDYWRPVHWVMQGELHRKRGTPRDLVTAEESFRTAIGEGTTRPEAWRGLGLTLMRSGKRPEGAEALATYLEMVPDAPDAAMMNMMIKGSQE
jgi:predicted Zn-dependent protease